MSIVPSTELRITKSRLTVEMVRALSYRSTSLCQIAMLPRTVIGFLLSLILLVAFLSPKYAGGAMTMQESARTPVSDYEEVVPEQLLMADGVLKQTGEHVDVFRLVAEGRNLKPVIRPAGEARENLQELQRQLRTGGGSSISGEGWEMRMNNDAMTATFSYAMRNRGRRDLADQQPLYLVELVENQSPRRELQIVAGEERAFLITLTGNDDGFFFRFKQDASGRVSCWELMDDRVVSIFSPSFDELCRNNRLYCQRRLFPLLSMLGAGVPQNRFGEQVRASVLLHLVPVDEAQLAEFKTRIADLNSGSFKVREAATEEVAGEFEIWGQQIQRGMDDPDLPVETRLRLKDIFEQHAGDSEQLAADPSWVADLTSDPLYLIWLLSDPDPTAATNETEIPDNARISEVKNHVGNRLKEITGQDFGINVDQWSQWLESHSAPVSAAKAQANNSFEDLLATIGPMGILMEDVGKLVRFRVADGQLQLDREYWSEQFNSKTAEEIIETAAEKFHEQNLPDDWFRPGGDYAVETTGLPQILFDSMAARARQMDDQSQTMPSYSNTKTFSWNRSFELDSISCQLIMQEERDVRRVRGAINSEIPEQTRFDLTVRERKSPARTFSLKTGDDNTLVIDFRFDESDALIRFVQRPPSRQEPDSDRCFLIELTDGQTLVMTGASFSELKSRHADYIREKFVPLLQTMKIEIVE